MSQLSLMCSYLALWISTSCRHSVSPWRKFSSARVIFSGKLLKTISIIFKPQFPDLLSYTISRDYMKIESFYSWWPDILSYSGVGIDVPLWGFVSHHITFNYLLEMTSLIVWWCETLGHWPTLDIPQPLRAAHRSRTPPNQEAPGENLENTWRKLQAESDKMARCFFFCHGIVTCVTTVTTSLYIISAYV